MDNFSQQEDRLWRLYCCRSWWVTQQRMTLKTHLIHTSRSWCSRIVLRLCNWRSWKRSFNKLCIRNFSRKLSRCTILSWCKLCLKHWRRNNYSTRTKCHCLELWQYVCSRLYCTTSLSTKQTLENAFPLKKALKSSKLSNKRLKTYLKSSHINLPLTLPINAFKT